MEKKYVYPKDPAVGFHAGRERPRIGKKFLRPIGFTSDKVPNLAPINRKDFFGFAPGRLPRWVEKVCVICRISFMALRSRKGETCSHPCRIKRLHENRG